MAVARSGGPGEAGGGNSVGLDAESAWLWALGSRDGLVRQRAREALVVRGRASVPPLVDLLSDPRPWVRWEAAKALAEIQDPSAAPALVEALEDESTGVRWLAGKALIGLGIRGLPSLLCALIRQAESTWFREAAHHVLRVMKRRGLAPVVRPVLAALDGPQPALEAPIAAQALLAALPEYEAILEMVESEGDDEEALWEEDDPPRRS